MKHKQAQQLALYKQLTRSETLAEVQLSYKSKVKPANLEKIITSQDSFQILKKIYSDDRIEHIEESIVLLLNRANKVLGWVKISQGELPEW